MAEKDEPALDALRKAGSRLDLPHPLRHYLYLPNRPSAEAAANRLRAEGFESQVQPAPLGEDWLVLATHRMVPSPERMARTRARFERLASEYLGEYDGWEAGITRG